MIDSTPAKHDRQPGDGFAALDAVHHRTLVNLDELGTLIESIEDKGITAQARVRAAWLVAWFGHEARRHHEDEERHVFPPLLSSGDAELVRNVTRLQQDHAGLEERWRALEPHLRAIANGLCHYDLDVLRSDVAVLAGLHRDHIELEESLIYPRARGQLGIRARREMGREMAARRRARPYSPP